jgi:hypothetical protein
LRRREKMGLRGRLKRLESTARDELASFELRDGSRYYYDPTSAVLFSHWFACAGAGNPSNWPSPPEIVRRLTEARDVRAALEEVMGDGDDYLTYDAEVLINERRLEPRSLVAGRDVYDQEVEDLSEP